MWQQLEKLEAELEETKRTEDQARSDSIDIVLLRDALHYYYFPERRIE